MEKEKDGTRAETTQSRGQCYKQVVFLMGCMKMKERKQSVVLLGKERDTQHPVLVFVLLHKSRGFRQFREREKMDHNPCDQPLPHP